jgi:hypothetical protein
VKGLPTFSNIYFQCQNQTQNESLHLPTRLTISHSGWLHLCGFVHLAFFTFAYSSSVIFFLLGVCFLLIWNIVSAAYRHHIYEKQGGPKSVELKEIGPRFELRLYQVCVAIMITIDFFCYVFHDGGLKQITTFT